jgi:hypothetical protein
MWSSFNDTEYASLWLSNINCISSKHTGFEVVVAQSVKFTVC